MSASGFIVLRPFCPGLHAYARNASLFGAAEPPAEADSPPLTPSAAMVCWSSWPEAFRPLEVWNSLTAFCVCGPIFPSAEMFSLVCACLMSSGFCAWLVAFASLLVEADFASLLVEAPAEADAPFDGSEADALPLADTPPL